jgi:hypothetical protein
MLFQHNSTLPFYNTKYIQPFFARMDHRFLLGTPFDVTVKYAYELEEVTFGSSCEDVQGLDGIMEILQMYTFLYYYGVGQLLPSIKLQHSLEWAHTGFEQSLVECCTILLEEHLQVTLEMLEVGICSSL